MIHSVTYTAWKWQYG